MQRYLITGGTGFIGQQLCRRLAARGESITVLSRNPARAAAQLPAGARIISALGQLAHDDPFDVVINLAGEPIAAGRWTSARKQALLASRTGVTEALLAWLSEATTKPAVLLSASAIGYYGDQQDAVVTEQTPPHSEFTHALCTAWEEVALRATDIGIRTAVLRIGLVLGPGGGFLQRMLPLFRLGLGGPIGSGGQWLSWIHREDLLDLLDYLITHRELEGVFNATAPTPVTSREFARALGRALHRPAVIPVPGLVFKLVFGEMSRLLLTGQRVLPARIQAAGFGFRFAQLDSALSDIVDQRPHNT